MGQGLIGEVSWLWALHPAPRCSAFQRVWLVQAHVPLTSVWAGPAGSPGRKREGRRGGNPAVPLSLPQAAPLTAVWSLQLLQPRSDKPCPGVSASMREPLPASVSHRVAPAPPFVLANPRRAGGLLLSQNSGCDAIRVSSSVSPPVQTIPYTVCCI